MRLNIFSHSDSFLTLQPTFAADPVFVAGGAKEKSLSVSVSTLSDFLVGGPTRA